MKNLSIQKLFLIALVISGWTGIILILYLNIVNNNFGNLGLNVSNVLSYFTVQSNIFVTFISTYLLIKGPKTPSNTLSLIVLCSLVNITITFIIYALVLESIWEPKGLTGLANQALHYTTPILYVAYWFFFREKREISLKSVAVVLIIPLLYFAYSLLRGPMVDFYPYPFIDARILTPVQILMNSVGLSVFFIFIGTVFILVGNFFAKRR